MKGCVIMAKFKDNYKDEIPVGEVRLYDMIDENNAYVGKGVKLVRSNGNVQDGDQFGSLQANQIFSFLNGLVSGSEKVKEAEYASKTDRLSVGSKDNPDRTIAFYNADGSYFRAYVQDGSFHICKSNPDGTTLRKAFSISSTGISTADQANSAPNGFSMGSSTSPNKYLKFYTGDNGTYYRMHAYHTGDPKKNYLWLELVDESGAVISTPLRVIDGVSTVDNAKSVPWSGVKDKPTSFTPSEHTHSENVSKAVSGLLMKPTVEKNVLSYAADGSKNGSVSTINAYSGGSENCPYTPFMGTKIQYYVTSTISFILLYEAAPVPGNVWMRVFNQEWRPWVCVSGRRELWASETGIKADGTATLSTPPSYFKNLELYIDILERPLVIPVNRYSESTYGGYAWCGLGDNFIVTSGQFVISGSRFIIAKLGHKNISNGTYDPDAKIVRIVGIS